mgnify:CR=1 FL=1
MTKQTLSFSRTDSAKFFKTLNKRVNDYFKENNIPKTANAAISNTFFIIIKFLVYQIYIIMC